MLHQMDDLNETAAQLIARAAYSYAIEIQTHGEIPGSLYDDVMTDLEAEILIMYRKITYGHWNLRDYREARLRQTSSDPS